MSLNLQICWLFILAIPVACMAWTVTHEEVFREPRTFFIKRSQVGKSLAERKFFYLFTCEYCFSHYVVILVLAFTRYHLLFGDWRGYILAGFSLVWIANVYMSLYNLIRIDIKKDSTSIKVMDEKLDKDDLT